jgi:hypothetical protein
MIDVDQYDRRRLDALLVDADATAATVTGLGRDFVYQSFADGVTEFLAEHDHGRVRNLVALDIAKGGAEC